MTDSVDSRQFEKALREECFYFFGLPYWEMSRDAASVAASPIFTDYIGFGDGGVGDVVPEEGSSIGNCIGSGIFKSERIGIAQGGVHAPADPPRCIQRGFQQRVVDAWWGADRVAELMAQPHYETFAVKLEGDVDLADPIQKLGLHTAGHSGVGGDVSSSFSFLPFFFFFFSLVASSIY